MTGDGNEVVEAALRSAPSRLWQQLFDTAHLYLAESEAGHLRWEKTKPNKTMLVDGEERQVLQMGYPVYSEHVGGIIALFYDIGVVFPFDWSSWDGVDRYRGGSGLGEAPVAEAARLATAYIRGDRFCDGLLSQAIEDGTFSAILERLLRWYDSERGHPV